MLEARGRTSSADSSVTPLFGPGSKHELRRADYERFACVGGVFLHRLRDLEEDPTLRKLMYVHGERSEFPRDVLESELE